MSDKAERIAAAVKASGLRTPNELAALINGVPLKECANSKCGQCFVLQQGRATKQYRTEGVAYCSNACAKATAQRAYRLRAKEENA